jgi:predicted flavoprotein YhiN
MYDPAPVPSYWEATAPADDPGWTPLEGDAECDVAVIGGGYTGLSAALHLARDHGVDVRVLEAGNRIGWGASGRNGGFCCMPATKMSVAQMTRKFGLDETKRFFASQVESIEFTRSLIADNDIDCDARGDGLMEVAHRPRAFGELKEYGETLSRLFGIETSVYSAEEFREIGHDSTEQFGAMKVGSCFALHPLKFVQGLARAASKAGATLHPGSLVTRWLREGGQHLLTTERGTLRAKRIIHRHHPPADFGRTGRAVLEDRLPADQFTQAAVLLRHAARQPPDAGRARRPDRRPGRRRSHARLDDEENRRSLPRLA